MLEFNKRGHLIPNHNILSSAAELHETFVEHMPSARRREVFDKYLAYSSALKEAVQEQYMQWLLLYN